MRRGEEETVNDNDEDKSDAETGQNNNGKCNFVQLPTFDLLTGWLVDHHSGSVSLTT